MKKRVLSVLIVAAMLIMLPGCWNYRELNEVSIVAGAALDKNEENNKYKLTVEVINSKGGKEARIIPDIMTMEGDTVFDAVRNMIKKTGRRIYWGHSKVFIINQDIAKEGVADVLDFVNRDAETRSDMYLLISQEKTAGELLKGKDEVHDIISFHIQDAMRAQKSLPKFKSEELWQYLKDLAAEGTSSTIPTAVMSRDKDSIVPEITGTALFKKDKMVGWLNGIESRSLLFLKGEIKSGLVEAIKVSEDTRATIEVSKINTKITPVVKDGSIYMDINLKIAAGVAEVLGKEDIISKDGRMKLRKAAEETIKDQLEKTLKKVREEYKTDVFGFGSTVQREMPEYWKRIKPEWEDIFTEMDVKINVEVEIKQSALTSKPIKVGD